MKKIAGAVCGATVIALGLSGCGASFEGSGSKDAASAEQLALRTDDPWAQTVQADSTKKADRPLADGVYQGSAPAMAGMVSVTLLVQDNHVTCIEVSQDGETQSVGGFEAIRDGKYAAMIDAAQGSAIDTVSGATITTAAVKDAVDEAMEQAEAALTGASARSAQG